jgi:hypothetical protein
MNKIILGFLTGTILTALALSGIAFALPQNQGTAKAPDFVQQLPESQLNKIVFIRYAEGFGKEKVCDYDGVCDPDETGWCADCKNGGEEPPAEPTCYGFLSGAKPHWNWIENYYYSDAGLGASVDSAVSTWEAVSGEIIGDGIAGSYPWGVYDLNNSISYGDYDDEGQCPTSDPCVIGVTKIWYRGKNIYEYDILFDTDYFPGAIDLDTVVLHEFGHAVGLDDLYNGECTSEVMYGTYDGVDLDLGLGDTAGIQTIY